MNHASVARLFDDYKRTDEAAAALIEAGPVETADFIISRICQEDVGQELFGRLKRLRLRMKQLTAEPGKPPKWIEPEAIFDGRHERVYRTIMRLHTDFPDLGRVRAFDFDAGTVSVRLKPGDDKLKTFKFKLDDDKLLYRRYKRTIY